MLKCRLLSSVTSLVLLWEAKKSSPSWRKLYWSLLLLFLLRRSVKRTTWANRVGSCMAWIEKDRLYFSGPWNSMPKKNIVRLADRKTRVFLVLLVAKENDLSLSFSLSLYIYSHDILQHVWSLARNRTVCKYVWRFACIPWEDLLIMSTQTCLLPVNMKILIDVVSFSGDEYSWPYDLFYPFACNAMAVLR